VLAVSRGHQTIEVRITPAAYGGRPRLSCNLLRLSAWHVVQDWTDYFNGFGQRTRLRR
jgi:hypothetical protein